ncbi:MAG: lysophospholipid acyltransferase family protein [Myxococcota bacterium]
MSSKLEKRIEALSRKNLNSFRVDPFGYDPESIKLWMPIVHWLYQKYFRVHTVGASNIPTGRVLVVANHSGQLPFDAMMISMAFMVEPKKPRLLRGMAERWSAELPFIGTLFARGGTIVGTPSACKTLLQNEEAVMVFPEGVGGISKLFKNRYKLAKFGHGFMRLAVETGTPILPVALIGAEEQAPSIANFKWLGKLFGTPGFPLIFPQIIPLPLPVKYRIHIGKPIYFTGHGKESDEQIANYVAQTKQRLQKMIDKGVQKRQSIFF